MPALTHKSSNYQVRGAREKSEPGLIAVQPPTTPIDLGDEILKVLKSNTIGLSPEGTYLPDDEYDRLLRRDRIKAALGGGRDVSPLVEYIVSCAKKTFATLLQVFSNFGDRRDAMASLMEKGFNDTFLESYKLGTSYFQHRLWNERTIDDFKNKRLSFILPTFDIDVFIYEFDKKQILPFTVFDEANTPSRSGHFSEVECVKMLASKQNKVDVLDKTVRVALKKLKKISDPGYNIRKEWEREARAHKQLNYLSENIIQAFAAYSQIATNKQLDEYYLVLEWANGGSLFDFWEKNPEPQVDFPDVCKVRRRVAEVLKQLHGLAQALEAMHSTRARSPGNSRKNSTSNSPRLSSQKTATWKEDALDNGGTYVDSSSLPTINIDSEEDSDGSKTIPSILVSSDPASLNATENSDTLNWRHGDIKPENILRFTTGQKDDELGVLKLADLGRAQQHQFVTSMRHTKEKELWRTRWYEPPDLEKKNHEEAQGKISRLFDIWSMGCVIFEAVLWLLYGHESHNVFLRANGFTTGEKGATPYWRKRRDGSYGLTEAVTGWMDHILEHDLERDGVIGDLIRLTRDRLLKIKLPPNSDLYAKGFRTNAKDLKQQLNSILERAGGDENYIFRGGIGQASTSKTSQFTSGSLLSAEDARGVNIPIPKGRGTVIAQLREYTSNIEDQWKTTPEDPSFVESMLKDRNFGCDEPELCTDCNDIDISSLHTETSHNMNTLETNSIKEECDLCEVIYTAAKDHGFKSRDGIQQISLVRSGDNFVLKGTNQKFLRLFKTMQYTTTPLAAPTLASLNSNRDPSPADLDSFMKLPRAWLAECNDNHKDVCAPKDTHILPTRLISVANLKKPKIVATADLSQSILSEGIRYIALSHKWGGMPYEAITTQNNLEQRQKKIPMDELPLSFRNAIAITSALGCTYLWIDSLCIIQGPDGDFGEEADKMQTTFNGAYCVLAACNAESAKVGFLENRESRSKYVKIGDVFISPITTDFERDVLHSPLARRGWVLQERALARRTIYFTDNQTYWECGEGIRCETLAKLKNDKIAFLGDPNFPGYTIRPSSTVGDQIKLFIDLFERYTSLEFSHPEDRPIAIDGLMERLTIAFKTRSLAGLFKTFWGRCLLWRRADHTGPLKKIPPGTHSRRTPPTWSWMAFDGAVSFIEPGGGQVSWNDAGVKLPFANLTGYQTSWLQTSCQNDSVAIQAKVFDFNIPANASRSEAYIYYDDSTISTAKCVIVGTDKYHANDASMKKHYVLIVKPLSDILSTVSYERCGVGYILGKYIRLGDPSVYVSIE
ncbi:putative protein kinase domain-containing protein [Botrytis fragariae]|uniref:Protein kinase domain-containing protein n=1 Tax=Botrytis fragariae TaxID=1964551 RepID=A0A8H6EEW9_9HELO|nr:putative protein kinase domain-containing protein [Botrytis fragariae]KAF5869598.1 putative protein kinase domain-containing protein [Botrytis fragariae]